MLSCIFLLYFTLVFAQPPPCDYTQLYNYSDFSIAYHQSTVYLSGGNPHSSSIWKLDLSQGIDVSQDCLPWQQEQPEDINSTVQPYMYGISFDTHDSNIFVQAGDGGTPTMDTGVLYNTTANAWSNVSANGSVPTVRAEMTATINTTTYQAWYYGGRTTQAQQHANTFNYFNDFYAFDARYNSWIWPTVNYIGGVRPARFGHTANLISGQLFILGGKTAMINSTTNQWIVAGADFRSVLVFDTMSNNSISMATIGNIPTGLARFSAANAPDGQSIVIFGGKILSSMFTPTQSVYVLDTCTLSWSQPTIQGTPPSARAGHEAVTYGQYMIVIGGIADVTPGHSLTYATDVGILDMNAWEWVTSIPANYSPSAAGQPHANCRFDMPASPPEGNGGDNGNGLPYDSTVVSNPYGKGSSALKEGLGITFGLLGAVLLVALAWYVRRMRRQARSVSPRWLPTLWKSKRKSTASSMHSTPSTASSMRSSLPPGAADADDKKNTDVPLVVISQHS
ncbi:hypothetical protein BC940DRAFT_309029 [Gongronella butleri]|nr:hypothetical protein BC940DRAFT_309029 [Gongronella butleri]